MGNCCKKASSMEFSKGSSKVFDEEVEGVVNSSEKERLLSALRASSDANGKVKIKISKKELKVLLGETTEEKQHGINNNSAEQVLAGLIKNARDRDNNDHHHDDAHHRPWKPVLQSIPEVN